MTVSADGLAIGAATPLGAQIAEQHDPDIGLVVA